MWAKLSAIYEQTSATSKLLLTRFHEYRMKPDDSVSQHIAKVENIARQLKNIGEEVSDITIMTKILGSLLAKYNAFVIAWDSVKVANQTIFNLIQRLIKEEKQLTATDETASAPAAVSLEQHKKGSKNEEQNLPKGDYSKQVRYKHYEYQYCYKGHIARNCRKRRNY